MEQYIGGKRAVTESLRAGRPIHKLWIIEKLQRSSQPFLLEAKKQGIVVQIADKRKLDQLVSDVPHQGVVAQIAAYDYTDLENLLVTAKTQGTVPFLLVLDEIEDPHNLGSILRTAECTGVHGVIIPKHRSAGLTAVVAKTSAGALEYVPVAKVTNLAQTLDRLKEEGFWIAGADGSAEETVFESDLTMPIAVVIGNEHKGIGRLIKQKCDFLARLPMAGQINSLNASVAAAAFMFETVRQRNLK